MKKLLAMSVGTTLLAGCSILAGDVDCNEESCIEAKVEKSPCTADGERWVLLTLTNKGTTVTRYRLDYTKPLRLKNSSDLGVGVIEKGKSTQHELYSKTFNTPLTVSIVQQSPDGKAVIHTEGRQITFAPC